MEWGGVGWAGVVWRRFGELGLVRWGGFQSTQRCRYPKRLEQLFGLGTALPRWGHHGVPRADPPCPVCSGPAACARITAGSRWKRARESMQMSSNCMETDPHSRPTSGPQLSSCMLHRELDSVWSGEAAQRARPQDPTHASHADKLRKEEGVLDFRESALTLHNKVGALS